MLSLKTVKEKFTCIWNLTQQIMSSNFGDLMPSLEGAIDSPKLWIAVVHLSLGQVTNFTYVKCILEEYITDRHVSNVTDHSADI